MKFQKGDKVIVDGLDLAFVIAADMGDVYKLFIEGENYDTMHHIIHARPDVLRPNGENFRCISSLSVAESMD